MKIVFMGTPDFAAHCLQVLLDEGHEVTAVYTQPDKPKGRGGQVQASPVKQRALLRGLPVYQPKRIRAKESVEELKKLPADIFVVAAFGQILSQEILDMPRYGCINVHASLLPKYRGAAPIQWAVINGDAYSGVTIQQMNAGVDTGDILYTREYRLREDETGESLFDALTDLGGEALKEALKLLEQGKLQPVAQDEAKASYAGKLTREMGRLNFNESAVTLERLVRGLNSWPSAYTYINGKQLKIWKAQVLLDTGDVHNRSKDQIDAIADASKEAGNGILAAPGTIIALDHESFTVACGEGALRILEVQLAGKKRMPVRNFLLGNAKIVEEGTKLQ
ncbi:MAG: methionyl-tRNA formyltransferase [Lachnospiraceae bacterium]|nr:methionyl-tRNA formyltransferase [Lachnospiraceae bacterium]